MELVIMAAGMGSRFGGLKQIEPVGPSGEFIIDYNIYDAIKCGFDKVILIIKEENKSIFEETIEKRISPYIKVEYVYQDNTLLGKKIDREKPLGTAHAILCAKEKVTSNFAVINADDFYGYDCFKQLSNHLKEMKDNEFGSIGYLAKNTITDSGSVKRGILDIKDSMLVNITESIIEKQDNHMVACPIECLDKKHVIDENTKVSMNTFALSPLVFDIIEESAKDFLKNIKDIQKEEFLLPNIIQDGIKKQLITVKVLDTTATWLGMTYKEDKEEIEKSIQELIDNNKYPDNLWKKENFE